jgi:hypothetical protein
MWHTEMDSQRGWKQGCSQCADMVSLRAANETPWASHILIFRMRCARQLVSTQQKDVSAPRARDTMLYPPIQLEEKSALSRAGGSISAIVLSTMESPARDQEPHERPSSLRSFGSEESYRQTPRHETDLSNETQESGATTTGILGERNHNGENQLGLPQTDHGNDNLSVRSIGQHKQIR